ncbi:hypothetical protein NP493_372g02023 [Ridgeia piscesae]|uniref:Actin n=1 Tax=Ridgeia piscesae TaxID=27915 RepID=A0AAD9L3W4_RIDPI|nr:hypothetical protein NP493_372g02023 [Ridgeia piscesae]
MFGTKRKKEDTFGQNDDDWNIYKEISKDAGNSDSEAEQEQLDELEMILREHDPEFVDPNQQEAMTFDIAEYYKLYIGIERIRVPELMLQPSMVGVEQAGLTDTIDFILHKFTVDEQRRLVQNVFLTGGCSSIPCLKERMETDLRAIRPFQSTFAVQVATDPVLGAWLGARQMTRSDQFAACCIRRADYEEMGGEYIKEHFASNRYARTPVLVAPTT